jgi:hypothetical protein
LGALAQHQAHARLPQRPTARRVRSHVLRHRTDRPAPGRNPIARASIRTPSEPGRFSTFLADAVSLAIQEQGTIAWFALRTDTTTFWIVDAFPSDGERLAHLKGAIASSLLANAERLLDEPPEILPADVLAAKLPQ